MKNKSGFISMTLVYSFFILFLFLMAAVILSYSEENKFLEALDDKINSDIGVAKDTKNTLLNTILIDNIPLASSNLDYNLPANLSVENGNGLFYLEPTNNENDITDENNDNYGSNIYYYRGNIGNNYVVYGKKFTRQENGYIQKESIKQMCWKIIRTNEDSSIRLAYSGIYDETNEECQTNATLFNDKFNEYNNDNAFVGYTYGGPGQTTYELTHYSVNNIASISSKVKTLLDDWYLNNTNFYYQSNLQYSSGPTTDPSSEVVSTLSDNIADSIFCNNRNVLSGTGIGNTLTNYSESLSPYIPSYKCVNSKDRYSLSQYNNGINTNINALTNSIGLLTRDDIVFAGGSSVNNTTYFLNYGKDYWTMTPHSFDGTANVFYVTNKGRISNDSVSSLHNIIPVISIKSNIIVQTGSGLSNDPYILGW